MWEAMPKLTGRCACGNITYETDAEPLVMMNCHCRDYQHASGSAFALVMAFRTDRLRLSGELKHFAVTTDRGNYARTWLLSDLWEPDRDQSSTA
jgi:hypothetical protein